MPSVAGHAEERRAHVGRDLRHRHLHAVGLGVELGDGLRRLRLGADQHAQRRLVVAHVGRLLARARAAHDGPQQRHLRAIRSLQHEAEGGRPILEGERAVAEGDERGRLVLVVGEGQVVGVHARLAALGGATRFRSLQDAVLGRATGREGRAPGGRHGLGVVGPGGRVRPARRDRSRAGRWPRTTRAATPSTSAIATPSLPAPLARTSRRRLRRFTGSAPAGPGRRRGSRAAAARPRR